MCSLSALLLHDSSIIDGTVLSYCVQALTHTESQPGGPYRTWIVESTASTIWKDIDIVVNANISHFLSLQEIHLEQVTKYIDQQIHAKKWTSKYYPDELTSLFFISRNYKGNYSQTIIRHLQSTYSSNINKLSALQLSFKILIQLSLGLYSHKIKKDIQQLLSLHTSGRWTASAYCIDPSIQSKTYYAGSDSVTLAFCCFALDTYIKQYEKEEHLIMQNKISVQENLVEDKIKKIAARYLKHIPQHKDTMSAVSASVPHSEICLLAYRFYSSLTQNTVKRGLLTNQFIYELGVANLLGWTAYCVYDDIFDDSKNTHLLPLLASCLHSVSYIYSEFNPVFLKYMTELEFANDFEHEHFHVGIRKGAFSVKDILVKSRNISQDIQHTLEILYKKSFGHAFGPLAVLYKLGFKTSSKEYKALENYFRHYLIARQLNDDAHDWYEDLTCGHLTIVNSFVIDSAFASTKKPHTSRGSATQFFIKNKSKLDSIFWSKVINSVAKIIIDNCEQAKKYLYKLEEYGVLEKSQKSKLSSYPSCSYLYPLIQSQQNAAQKAIDESTKMKQFLKNY
jgi:hypothetical protein